LTARQGAAYCIGTLPEIAMASAAIDRSGSAPSLEAVIAERLGGAALLGRQVDSLADLASLVGEGLPTEAIERVRGTGRLAAAELEAIIPQRTLRHRRSRGERLTPEESDRAVRLLRVQAEADRAFGDAAKSDAWLRRPLRALDGARPIDLATTEAGARLVEQVLAGIAWGAAA
jgi:putative toxin-antitoxin system antitoxin component (TIGR02293 family)